MTQHTGNSNEFEHDTEHDLDVAPTIRSEAAFFDTFGDSIHNDTDDSDAYDEIAYLRDNELSATTITGGTGSTDSISNTGNADNSDAAFTIDTIARARRLLTIHTVSSWCTLALGIIACSLAFFAPRITHAPQVLTWTAGGGFLIMLIVTATTSALRARTFQTLGIAPE